MLKLAGHPEDRLRERTRLPKDTLVRLRSRLRRIEAMDSDKGFVRLRGGHYAAIKRSKSGKPFIATVLHRDMIPQGKNMTSLVAKRGDSRYA